MPPSSTAETLSVDVEGGTMPARLVLPPAGRGPGIVLLQEVFGVTGYVRSRAGDLAAQGYAVLVPEVYWRQGSPVLGEGMAGLGEAVAAAGRVEWPEAVADVAAALEVLRARPEVQGGVALVGFCFGGGLAFSAAAATCRAGQGPDALVSYYGSAIPQHLDEAGEICCPSLHHWGESDAFFPPEVVDQVQEAVTGGPAGTTFVRHPGAGHAFDNPSPDFHHAEASRDAWGTTTAWLREHLPTG